MLADLAVIIHKADEAEAQGKEIDIQMGKLPVYHLLPAAGKGGNAAAQNKRDAAHGGRSRFGIVPCGTVLPDFLSGLQLPQFR